MYATQQHISIADIQNDILLLKDGGGALVLQVSAVNFGLLSGREQVAIISSFAQMLNSLSFSIQIVIISERLNIGSYLLILDRAQKAQTNPLLAQMITQYRQFIQTTIKENEVLDKRFYIIIPLFSIELGLKATKESLEQKIKTVLLPRRDQIIRQLGRIGLKSAQLTKSKLIELFYDIYNSGAAEEPLAQPIDPKELMVRLKNPQPISASQQVSKSADQPTSRIADTPTLQPSDIPANRPAARTHPFVVEELEE